MVRKNEKPKAINLSSIGNINIPIESKSYNISNEEDNTEINTDINTDDISNVIINKLNTMGLNMKSTNSKIIITDKKGDCLRLSNNNNNVDMNVKNDGIFIIKPSSKTVLLNSSNEINISSPLSLLNCPNIKSENNIGVGLNYDLKTDNDDIKTFGTIDIIGKNITNKKETSDLHINLMRNGKMNKALSLTSDGVLSITRLVESSDEKLKENICLANLKDSYNKIMNIKVKDYNYKNDKNKKKYCGVIAQELQKIIPNAVNVDNNNIHHVSTKELLYHIIGAIQYINNNV